MHLRAIACATVLFSFATSHSYAAVVVAWDFDGVDMDDGALVPADNYAFFSTTNISNVSGILRLGSGVNPSTAGDRYGFKVPDEQTSLAGAIAASHYIELAFDISTGYELDLTSLEFLGETTGTGAQDVAILSSLNGYTDSNAIATLAVDRDATGSFDTDASGFGAPIDLTNSTYQNLTGSFSFRLYGFNTSSGAGDTYFRSLSGDDLVLNGTVSAVAIPEPASLLFLSGFGGIAFMLRRRQLQCVPAVDDNV